MRGGGTPTPPAQRASNSESHACTLIAVSCGNPGSCGVERTGEQPPTVASESDRGSSNARGSSSSIIDPHSHDCHHPRGLTSSSVLSSSSATPLDGDLGSASPRPSASLCSSPSGWLITLWLANFLLHLLIIFFL